MILLTPSWNPAIVSYLSNLLLSQEVSDNNYLLLREFYRCEISCYYPGQHYGALTLH